MKERLTAERTEDTDSTALALLVGGLRVATRRCAFIACALAAGTIFVAPVARAQFSFGSPSTYSVTQSQYGLASADMNGDGFKDLVAATPQGVAVLLNNGNGTFGAPVFYSASYATYAYGVVVGDLNSDGHPDVAIPGGGGIGVLLNNGDGTLGSVVYYLSGTGLFQVNISSGDYYQNGLTDIALVEVGYFGASPTLTLFKNQGNGMFAIGLQMAMPAGVDYSLLTADVNGDGYPDLVTADCNGGNPISVFINQKNGTFGAPVNYSQTIVPCSLLGPDLNHDGYPDLVAWAYGSRSFTESFQVMLNHGDGTFASASYYDTSYTGGGQAESMVAADFDGDGNLDLADYTNNTSPSWISVLKDNGDGTFQSGQIFTVAPSTTVL